MNNDELNKDEFPSLLTTEQAAKLLGRSAQTLRRWSCHNCAPSGIRPIRLNRRLLWREIDLRKVVRDAEQASEKLLGK